jgi:hypothetical protein
VSRTPGFGLSRSADSQRTVGDTETRGWRVVGVISPLHSKPLLFGSGSVIADFNSCALHGYADPTPPVRCDLLPQASAGIIGPSAVRWRVKWKERSLDT